MMKKLTFIFEYRNGWGDSSRAVQADKLSEAIELFKASVPVDSVTPETIVEECLTHVTVARNVESEQ